MTSVDPLLPWIRKGAVGVEIGVAQGHSAKALLDHGVRFLYLIDPWADYDDLLDRNPPGAWEECYRTVVACYPSRHAVLRMTSAEAARYVPGNLDFVWVDGNHRYEWVRSDLELYWPKLKPGGILCGHDYCDDYPTCGVKSAVEWFLVHVAGAHEWHTPADCWVIIKQ